MPTIAVIGAGVMGSQISQILAVAGFEVRLYDIDSGRLASSIERIRTSAFGLDATVGRGKLTAEAADVAISRVRLADSLEAACAGVDGVLEAVIEDLEAKVGVLRLAAAAAPSEAILATNTAGLSITAVALAVGAGERVIGWHWFQPCAVMALNEIVVHPRTSAHTVETVTGWAQACGKSARIVRDNPRVWGHVANRINRAVLEEARRVVADGAADEATVDAIMREGFRWPLGPFEMEKLPH